MGSTPDEAAVPAELLVIDYPLLSSKDSDLAAARNAERRKFYEALRNIGFVYLKKPNITQDGINKLFSISRTFFSKPESEKMKILGKMDKGRGPSQGWSCPLKLAANPDTSDLKEFFGMYRDDDEEKPNQWLLDADSQTMRRELAAFFDSCHGVVRELLSVLAEAVGLESDAFDAFVTEKNHFIACLHYPPTSIDSFQRRVRAGAHTDYGCLTLLFNDAGEGLQVMGRDGQYQHIARRDDCAIVNGKGEPKPGSKRRAEDTLTREGLFLVGDLLSRFFNGGLPSTMHRVIEPPSAGREIPGRYSIAYFGQFNADLVVQPLDACCSEEQPARFPPVVAGEHVKARVKQLHVAGHSTKKENIVGAA